MFASTLGATKVADAMHRGIVACEPDATLVEVARIMADHRVHCLAVIGVSHEAPPCGMWSIITDRDLLRASVRPGLATSARSLARQPLVSVTEQTLLSDAGELMLEHGVSHLIVVQPGTERPVGVLSTLDVAAVMASDAVLA